jgi:hypothetical protein
MDRSLGERGGGGLTALLVLKHGVSMTEAWALDADGAAFWCEWLDEVERQEAAARKG